MNQEENFTKFEIARIIGARALQIAMDAPLLLKIDEEKLKEIKYDALKIAELEFNEGVLPITVSRPTPDKGSERISSIKEEKVSDEEVIEKAKELEKEIVENPDEYSLVEEEKEEPEESKSEDEQ
jgi:DNA-directed RNA polymerase subunit K